jgi:V8-like Glu-specific endopeptidase
MIDIPERWKYCAERIFDIKFGVTGYWKDRYGTGYQYTSEEEVVLRLRAVLV